MRLLPVTKRVDIRVAARQQECVKSGYNSVNVVDFGDQTDVNRRASRGLNGFAVMS
jgi:hypothetical protein